MARTTQREPPRPTRLALKADEVRARIRARLDAADPLLKTTMLNSEQDLDVFLEQVGRWSSLTNELLRRLFDSDEFADSFSMASRSYVRSPYTQPYVIFNQAQTSLRSQFAKLQTILEMVDILEEIPNPIRPTVSAAADRSRSSGPVVHVKDSTIGTLNLGDIKGSIENSISTLGPSAADFKTAMARLLEAATSAPGLDEIQRREALEDLDELAKQAQLEPGERKAGLIRTLLAGLGSVLALTDKAHAVYQEWQPTIAGFLTAHRGP